MGKHLNDFERHTLINQYNILLNQKLQDKDNVTSNEYDTKWLQRRIDALYEGYTEFYFGDSDDIHKEMSVEQQKYGRKLLNMYDMLSDYSGIKEFVGFDNNEDDISINGYMEFIMDNDRYESIKKRFPTQVRNKKFEIANSHGMPDDNNLKARIDQFVERKHEITNLKLESKTNEDAEIKLREIAKELLGE